jgi:hypothetical protein
VIALGRADRAEEAESRKGAAPPAV